MRIVVFFALVFLLATPGFSKPADWGNNEWYQFFEAAVSTMVGEWHGAAAEAGTAGAGKAFAPMVDVYSALSGMSSAVKPGLIMWLHNKRVEAELDGDAERGNRYQAFETALAQDDSSRLRELLLDYEIKRRKLALPSKGGESEKNDDKPETQVNVPGFGQMSKHPFNGRWKTLFGIVTLAVDDSGNARGSYSYRLKSGKVVTGTLTGRVTGYVLSGHWVEKLAGVPDARGDMDLTMTADGTHFSGPWHTTAGTTAVDSGEWKADKIGAGQ